MYITNFTITHTQCIYAFPMIIRTRNDCCRKNMGSFLFVMKTHCVRFQVLTAVLMKIQVFGKVTVCRLVNSYRSGRMYRLCLQARAVREERHSLLYFMRHELNC
jgi:hypothetical protein